MMYASKPTVWTSPSPTSTTQEENGEGGGDGSGGLADVFYTNEGKELIHVRLNKTGITLQKGGSNNKEKIIKLNDIVGGRCIINKSSSSSFPNNCGCSSLTACSANYGSRTPNGGDDTSGQRKRELCAYFHVYAYVLRPNIRNVLRRERTVLVLRFCSFDTFEENMQEAERWQRTLNLFTNEAIGLNSFPNAATATATAAAVERARAAKKLILFLNPKSGSGKARRFFHLYAAPVLNEADLPYDLLVTKHINYAKEFVRQRDLSAWSSIIAVGGDGLFFEILNGLLKRKDWQQIMQNISLGIVPCGTGNGLAKSISHIYNEPYEPRPILSAALTIVRGHTAKMDVVRLELKNQILYSFLSVGWGFISDIDIESERLRSLGYQRFTLWSLHRLISLRTYRGRVSYLLKTRQNDVDENELSSSSSIKNSTMNLNQLKNHTHCHHHQQQHAQKNSYQTNSCNDYVRKSTDCLHLHRMQQTNKPDNISLQTSLTRSFRSGLESWCSVDSCESMYYSIAESIYRSIPASEKEQANCGGGANEDNITIASGCGGEQESIATNSSSSGPIAIALTLNDPLPANWTIETGEFVMVQATYQTHLSTDCYFSPASKLNDATIYLVIIRGGIGRSQLLQFLLNMSSGTHIHPTKQDNFIKVVAVSAFRIEPEDSQGILTVDGERVEFGPIQGAVIPEIVSMIVPN